MACFHTYNNVNYRQKSQTLQPIRNNIDKEHIMNSFLSQLNSVESDQEPANYANVVNPDASEETLLMQSRSNTMRLSPNSRGRLAQHHQYHIHNQHNQHHQHQQHTVSQQQPVAVSQRYNNLRRAERLELEQQQLQFLEANQTHQQNLHCRTLSQFHHHKQHQHSNHHQHHHQSNNNNNLHRHQTHKQPNEAIASCGGPEPSPVATTAEQDNYYNLVTVPKLLRQQSGKQPAVSSLQNSPVSSERKTTTFENLKQFSPPPQASKQTSTSAPNNHLDTVTMMQIYCALGQLDSCPQMPPSRSYAIASSNDSCLLFKVAHPHRRFLRESFTDPATGVCLPAGSVVYVLRCSELDRSKLTVSFSDQLPPIDVPHQLTDIARPTAGRN